MRYIKPWDGACDRLMGKIAELARAFPKDKSTEYQQGWGDAISHVNDNYELKDRNDKDDEITISIELPTDPKILETLAKEILKNDS